MNDSMRGRQVVLVLANKSGGTVVAGDVVIVDRTQAGAFTTTTVAGPADSVGVALETIAAEGRGRICLWGYVPAVNLAAPAAVGDYLYIYSIAKQAQASSEFSEGAFGMVLAEGAAPAALLRMWPYTPADLPPHEHVEADITDLVHDAVSLQGRALAAAAPADGQAIVWDGVAETWKPGTVSGGTGSGEQLVVMTFGVSGDLVVGASPVRLHAPYAFSISNVVATVETVPVGGAVVLDVHMDGVTIFTNQANRPTIAAGRQDDLDSVPDVTAVAQNAVLTLHVDAVGPDAPGANLVVQVRGVKV